MMYRLLSFATVMAFSAAQICPPPCMQSFGGGCGGCGGGIRAYRMMVPPPMMGPCGGSPCGPPPTMMMPMPQNPCNGGGCGGMGQQAAYGIPDPIITESGRVIRAPFLPPPALPPQPIGQNPMANTMG